MKHHTLTIEIPIPKPLNARQLCIIRDVLESAAVTFRYHIRESVAAGDDVASGFYARELVRVERASHIVWNLADHFPTNEN